MHQCRLLILAALIPEARAIAQVMSVDGRALGRGRTWVGSEEVVVGIMGIGARLRERVLAEVLPERMMVAGVGGGLAPLLKVGDVVVAGLEASVCARAGAIAGAITTVDAIVSTPAAKAELFGRTGALAVDMETQYLEAFAREKGIRFVAVRAISDAADEALDPALLTLVDPMGRPSVLRAMKLVSKHPGKIAEMLLMKRAMDRALMSLGKVVKVIALSDWPESPVSAS